MAQQVHFDAVAHWATKDAELVVSGKHACGRQAEIRMRLIDRMEKVSTKEKYSLYEEYCKQLDAEIRRLAPAGNFRSTMPTPQFS